MSHFEETHLWQYSLGDKYSDSETSAREREELRTAYFNFRKRASTLVSEISHDLPDFTVHDVTHIDALWEMADLIAGPEIILTPTEAFVLGGAFLLHDAGMALASYPNGIETLKKDSFWRDCAAALEIKKAKAIDDSPPISDEETEKYLIAKVLRERHARQAETLTNQVWKTKSGDEYRLINDPDLRHQFGALIGQIAHSHWWPTERLSKEFPEILGASGRNINQWTVDPLKIACLLRVADAAHLDERRAPGFLQALRQPRGLAQDHWDFQGKMNQPLLKAKSNLLCYTSSSKFEVNNASAWWTCYETLSETVDRELREVDRLLISKGSTRFAARGVFGVENPSRLSECIKTKDWEPVDSRVKVTNVAGLVKRLGGQELYGNNPHVPLRELIQNSADAIRARRLLQDRASDWGNIIVRLGHDDEGEWLEVEDNGIGMSTAVLTGPFLDFGESFWDSDLALRELSGLSERGFVSSGRYGIGFFSIFMLGKRIQITTKRYDKAEQDTKVLEFNAGLKTRPIIRSSSSGEVLIDGGTRIRVWLNTPSTEANGLLYEDPNISTHWNLRSLCSWLCPSLDVTLRTQTEGEASEIALTASDWITMAGKDLIARLLGNVNRTNDVYKENVEIAGENLRLVQNAGGETVGRVCIFNRHGDIHAMHNRGAVTTGGIRADQANGIAGILTGTISRAVRDRAIPYAKLADFTEWVKEQVCLLEMPPFNEADMDDCAEIARIFGGSTQNLKIASHQSGKMSATEIAHKYGDSQEVVVLSSNLSFHFRELVLLDSILQVDSIHTFGIVSRPAFENFQWPERLPSPVPEWSRKWQGLEGVIAEVLANAWSVPLEDLARVSSIRDDYGEGKQEYRRIGTDRGEDVWEHCDVFRNPRYVS